MKYADGIMALSTDTALVEYARQTGKPLLTAEKPEDFCTTAPDFFDQIWGEGKVETPEEDED